MDKQKILRIISLFLIIGFFVRLGADYYKYDSMTTSFPFYVYFFERIIEFLVPSLIIVMISKKIK